MSAEHGSRASAKGPDPPHPASGSPQSLGGSTEERVPFSVIFAFSVPIAAMSMVFTPFGIYWMKYATDVLLVAPGAIGVVRSVASLWDAISDPLVGNLTDRTQTRWGRRRPWIVAGAIPLGLTYVLLWTPPASLDGLSLILWIGAAYLLYETASTVVFVPYQALGLEISEGHHDRTRVFAWQKIIMAAGSAGGLGTIYLLLNASDKRSMAFWLAVAAGGAIAAAMVFAASKVPERDNYQRRGVAPLGRSFGDVFRNPHARIFLAASTIEAFGMAIVPGLVMYVLDDVLQDESVIYIILAVYMGLQFGLIPLWVRLSHRIGKKTLWLTGMGVSTVGFAATMMLEPGAYLVMYFSICCLAVGLGISTVIGPSVTADIIDADELRTGERKEGSYAGVMNFIRKLGLSLAASVAGFGLEFSGYDPALEVQPQQVQDAIVWMAGGIPFVCYAIGTLLFARFGLTSEEHARIQRELAVQREQAAEREGPHRTD